MVELQFESVFIALELLGGIGALIFMMATSLIEKAESKMSNRLAWLEFMVAGLLFSNAVSILHNGMHGSGEVILRISVFLEYLFGYFAVCEFTAFLWTLVKSKGVTKVKGRVYTVYIIHAIAVGLLITTRWTNFYYYFDENNSYVSGDFFFVSPLIAGIAAFIALSIVIEHRHKFKKELFTSLIIYVLIPVVGAIVEVIFPRVPAINLSMMVDGILIFFAVQMEAYTVIREQRKKLYVSQMETLLSQINPEFIFDSLHTIKGLCKENGEEAYTATDNLCTYLQGSLAALNGEAEISFKDELSYTKNYLGLELAKYDGKIAVDYDLRATDFMIPPLTLQPLVENAIKHGFAKKGTGVISISSYEEADNIIISVSDDGAGFDASAGPDNSKYICVGLENVRYRIDLMCKGTVEVDSAVGEGTTVTIKLPKGE